MFNKLGIPIIGIVENMSSVKCPACSNSVKLFGDGAEAFAKDIGSVIIQKIPLLQQITESCDNGIPIVIKNPDSEEALAYKNLAQKVVEYLRDKRVDNKAAL